MRLLGIPSPRGNDRSATREYRPCGETGRQLGRETDQVNSDSPECRPGGERIPTPQGQARLCTGGIVRYVAISGRPIPPQGSVTSKSWPGRLSTLGGLYRQLWGRVLTSGAKSAGNTDRSRKNRSRIPTFHAKNSRHYRPLTQVSDRFYRRGACKVRMLVGRTPANSPATDAYPPSPTIPTPRANPAVIEEPGAPQYRRLTHAFVARSRKTAHFCRADGHNTDPWHNEYRPRGQRIQTPCAREYRPAAHDNTDRSRKNRREYRPLMQRIPTPRASLV